MGHFISHMQVTHRLIPRTLQIAAPQRLCTHKRFRHSSPSEISVPFENPQWSKSAPEGFQYAWLKEADTVTLIPKGWHTSCETEGDSIRYIITKENPEKNQNTYQTGFTFSQWKVNDLPTDAVMDQVDAHNLGIMPSMFLSQLLPALTSSPDAQSQNRKIDAIRAQHSSPYILSFLKDLNVHIVDYKMHEIPDILRRKTIEFVKFAPNSPVQRTASTPQSNLDGIPGRTKISFSHSKQLEEGATKEIDETLLSGEPKEDTYVLSHSISMPSKKSVMSLVLECPLKNYSETKPVFDTVMDHSVLSCHSDHNRVLFSDVLLQKQALDVDTDKE